MLFIVTSEKRKCACCQSRKTNESYKFEYCNIHIEIPLCEKCQKTAIYNLDMQLKPLLTAINRAITMSHIVGWDERKIRDYQQKERELKVDADAD